MTQVRLRNIIKRFGSAAAVAGVSLDIASGEFVCLLGASGCGKTTLLRILGGFTQPDSGDILIDGKRRHAAPEPPQGCDSSFSPTLCFQRRRWPKT